MITIEQFKEKNKMTMSVDNIITLFGRFSGGLTPEQFDYNMKDYKIVDGKVVRREFVDFPPLHFICANGDSIHAWHLHTLQLMCKEGFVTCEFDGDGRLVKYKLGDD